ncbi:MAG: signal recognition particle receptor subunit alpha, partial [Ilumatobacteraceae bacterium]
MTHHASVGADMDIQWLFLILAIVVLVFGLGVVAANRRKMGSGQRTELPPRPAPSAPPTAVEEAEGDTLVEEPPVVEPEPEPVKPLSLRDRLSKARATFSGAFGSILGRGAITDETWDDLEEALLRADVGLGVADGLLEPLKERVKAKEITEPSNLLAALQADMIARL